MTLTRNKSPASRALEASSSRRRANLADESAQLFWIRISNVHTKVAYEDIVRALFQRCVMLRSEGANPSYLGGHFQDTIEVAFATKEDAKDAVDMFKNRIKLFQQYWNITHYRPKRSSNAGYSSLRISATPNACKSSDDEQAEVEKTRQDAAVDDTTKVSIFYIDERVPIEVVVPLCETAGRVRSHSVLNDSNEVFHGTVEVEYADRKGAVAAAKLLNNNITFYGLTWYVKYDHADEHHDDDVEHKDEHEDEHEDKDDDGDDNTCNDNDDHEDDNDDDSGDEEHDVEDDA